MNVTSDKCYENKEWVWGYRENEPMGGHDPYSNSKGCAELVTSAYRNSFFSASDAPAVASARAGNVIGGGDWADDRLIPDILRNKFTDFITKLVGVHYFSYAIMNFRFDTLVFAIRRRLSYPHRFAMIYANKPCFQVPLIATILAPNLICLALY